MFLKNILILVAFVPFVVSRKECEPGHKWSDDSNCCKKEASAPSPPPPPSHDCAPGMTWSDESNCCKKEASSPAPAPAPAPAPSSSKDCPPGTKWLDNCCKPTQGSPPASHDCAPGMTWNDQSQSCTPSNNCPSGMTWNDQSQSCGPSSPQPSGSYKRGKRRSVRPTRCPSGLEACPVSGFHGQYECFDTARELESCGGCATLGQGQDCTKIEGAWNVACERGICKVYTCEGGYRLDAAKNSCVLL